MINFTGPLKIVQTPGMVAILYETSNNYRQIFSDGRDLPKDPNPTWQGYSVGHWDGDTLVVDTIGFNDKSMIGRPSYPHSEELRVTERYRRRDFGHVDLQMLIDDQKAFSRPWTIPAELIFQPDSELLEFVCNENETDRQHFVVSRGNAVTVERAILAKYVGTYELTGPGGRQQTAIVTLDGDQLTLDAPGVHSPLVPQSSTTFLMNRGAIVEFVVNEQGEVTHLIGHVAEGQFKGPRVGPVR